MDRLLTDTETSKLGGMQTELIMNLLTAQDAKSIKVDRQAMAEWWMGECAGDAHHESGERLNCRECSDDYWNWVEGKCEGKAPWEAD